MTAAVQALYSDCFLGCSILTVVRWGALYGLLLGGVVYSDCCLECSIVTVVG